MRLLTNVIIDECDYNRKHGIKEDKYNGFIIYSDLSLEEYMEQNNLRFAEDFFKELDEKLDAYLQS